MLKFIPLVLLAGLMTVSVVAAPKPVDKEGLISHDAAGKAYVVQSIPALSAGPRITARLRVKYVVAGLAGEKYTVELWLGRTGDDRIERYHFDTQQLTIPDDKAGKLKEAKGRFDRRYHDRDPGRDYEGPRPRQDKPGEYSLLWVGRGKSWDCRLVVKKEGKVVSDTGYFQVVLDPVIEL